MIFPSLGKGYVAKKLDALFGEETIKEILSEKKLLEYVNNASDIPVLPLFQLHRNIETLRDGLGKIATPPKHIVFLVDELDRAKPLFAIQTLEVIKHIFDADRVSYIFALDMEQLSHTVKSVYGEGMDSIGYLQRFFDQVISMPRDEHKMDEYILTKLIKKTER